MSTIHPLQSMESTSSFSNVSDIKNKALIANLWVILATILISATVTVLFGDESVSEALIGFSIYFASNSLALWAAYNKHDKWALYGYTTQVFIVCTAAMVLLNDIPAHLVLAMVNFVLLHAVVVGSRTALIVTGIMVSMLVGADILGELFAPAVAQKVAAGEMSVALSERTTLLNLITTTISTGYLIVTTIGLQDQARQEALNANQLLSAAQTALKTRMKKDQLLSTLGAEVAAARSQEELNESLLKTLRMGLPTYDCRLSSIGNEMEGLPIRSGQTTRLLQTVPELTFEDRNFAQNAINLIEGALTRMGAEKRARQTERLEGVGKLAASIAHDFNNLLVPITAAVETQNNPNLPPHIQQAAGEATVQASALVEKLLTHACSIESTLEPLDLCAVIENSEPLLRSFIDGNAKLIIQLPDTPAPIMADVVEIEQILLNTILNSVEATEKSGEIKVIVKVEQDTVLLEIKDNGPGIPKSIQSWVLEPFHTTKTEGSGLGLTTVNRIVSDYNGTLRLSNLEAGGASIQITLPKIDTAKLKHNALLSPQRTQDSYNILLVDDDTRVGITVKMMLESLNHQVEYISDSRSVSSILTADHTFDLVLTDYQMPGVTGEDIVQTLRENQDSTPVIVLSGYGAALNTERLHRPNLVLSKPIRMHALNAAIYDVMTENT